MKAQDVMNRDVVSILPEATVRDATRLMLDHRISALPVVNADAHVLGVVSEGDLLHRRETGTERRRPWWLQALVDNATLADEYAKAHGVKVRDIMSSPAITVSPGASLNEIATLLEKHRIKRVPVTSDGGIVGIVSRADLLRAFAASTATADDAESDRDIRAILLAKLKGEPWVTIDAGDVKVAGGVVQFRGVVASEDERRALRAAAEGIAGVKDVQDHTRLPTLAPWTTAS